MFSKSNSISFLRNETRKAKQKRKKTSGGKTEISFDFVNWKKYLVRWKTYLRCIGGKPLSSLEMMSVFELVEESVGGNDGDESMKE
jgi:hypothetical protein